MSDKFHTATGRTIGEWMEYMRPHGELHDLSHRELAALASSGGASDWWAQSIAVEIERIIGRRQIGQTGTGSVAVSASKTLPGEWTTVFDRFVDFMSAQDLSMLVDAPRISATEKWRYWRADATDGSAIAIDCSDVNGRTRLSVKHDKLPGMDDREPTKQYWRALLNDFARSLSSQ